MALFRKKKHTPIAEIEPQKDENGRIILDMTVRDDSDFLSPFSKSKEPTIASEVAEFLESRVDTLTPRDTAALHIHSSCIEKDEEKHYRRAIKAYYTEQYHANRRQLRRNSILAAILLALGILTLAVMIVIDALIESMIWTEVIDIAAWVFLWEAVDLHILEGHALRVRQRQILALLSMEVSFFALD